MSDANEFQAQLKVLSAAYAAQLPENLAQIELAWNTLMRGEWDDEGFRTLHRRVHSLTGSGRIFGFALLSDAAHSLEETLQQIVETQAMPSEEQRKSLRTKLCDLHAAAGTPGPSDFAAISDGTPSL